MVSRDNSNHHPRRRPENSRRPHGAVRRGSSARRGAAPGRRRQAGRYRRIGLIPAAVLAARNLRNRLVRSPLVPILGGLLALGFIVYAGIWMFTNKNAYDIFVGEKYVACISIARNRDISEEYIFNNAKTKLSEEVNSTIWVDPETSKVTIKSANRPRNDLSSVEFAISAVYEAFKESYKLEAADIVVNDEVIVTLRSEAEAKSVLEDVMRSYTAEGAVVVEKSWEDDIVKIVPRHADYSEIESSERAFAELTFKTEAESTYQVRRGDTIWQLCQSFGITQDRLIELNPDIPEVVNGSIKSGQIIKIVIHKPRCSVRTVEEVISTEVEKRIVEERPNYNRPVGYRNVIQEGRDGTREVMSHVVKVNGVELNHERKEITSKTLVAPIVEIVEVGTQ